MGSGYRHDFTENLEAVARGVRRLEDVSDPAVRDAIRTALGLAGEGPGLDAARRARIRRIVLAAAVARQPRPSDRAVGLLTMLAAPAPYVVRFLAAVICAVGLLAGATVASADSLPDDPLYGVKRAAEQLRLALAVAPEDRASVELSLAEHRLSEAERLAARGGESGALIATSAYAAHLASAAAELSQVDAVAPRAVALVAQLESKLAEQRSRAADTAQRLRADPRTALAGAVLSTVATTPAAGGMTAASRIAESAAAISTRISAAADAHARMPTGAPPGQEGSEDADEGDGHAPAAPAASARPTGRPAAEPTAQRTVDPSARTAAKKAREAAETATKAAERSRATPKSMPTKAPRR